MFTVQFQEQPIQNEIQKVYTIIIIVPMSLALSVRQSTVLLYVSLSAVPENHFRSSPIQMQEAHGPSSSLP